MYVSFYLPANYGLLLKGLGEVITVKEPFPDSFIKLLKTLATAVPEAMVYLQDPMLEVRPSFTFHGVRIQLDLDHDATFKIELFEVGERTAEMKTLFVNIRKFLTKEAIDYNEDVASLTKLATK